ncbi:MAG: glycosyltransferase [Actinobacteria bacterium]|nr:glycosyltransferase [Actinomycetota bacterium]
MGAAVENAHPQPVISVVIPAYNAEATIGDQLAALSRNSLDETWEVIVADNGSTDETARVARLWADRLPLRVVDASARRGPGAARNIGVEASRSSCIAFCDADDLVADDWLPKVLAALRVDEFAALGVLWRAPYSSRRRPQYVVYALYASEYVPGLVACGSSHMAVRAEPFRAIGGFDETLLTGEDHDLCYRLQLEGHRLMPHPEAVVTWRRRERLLDLFRQQYRWGADERALQHKYARVRPVLARALADGWISPPDPRDTAVTPLDTRVARSDRASSALRSTAELSDLIGRLWSRTSLRIVQKVAFWAGRRMASIDTDRTQVEEDVAERYVAAYRGRPAGGAA